MLQAQEQIPVSYILKHAKTVQTDKVEQDKKNATTCYIATPFASPVIISNINQTLLKTKTITRIELVYTRYKLNPAFNQQKLNEKRLLQLQAAAPYLFAMHEVVWQFTEQTACASPAEGRKFFHGFIIHFRPGNTPTDMEYEVRMLEELIGEKKTKEKSAQTHTTGRLKMAFVHHQPVFPGGTNALNAFLKKESGYPIPESTERIKGVVLTSFTITENGQVKNVALVRHSGTEYDAKLVQALENMPLWEPALLHGKKVSSTYVLPVQYYENGNMEVAKSTLNLNDGFDYAGYMAANHGQTMQPLNEPIEKAAAYTVKLHLRDSSMLHIFERNKHWRNALLVVDVTGSMYPYLSQILVWFKENEALMADMLSQLVFFNDGNNMPDKEKKTGQVGGLYTLLPSNFAELKNNMKVAMLNGGGGDREENNIEALLHGIEKCGSCKQHILVADNLATPRDLSLAKQLKESLHIVLCGTHAGINTHYLNLARQTHGSIHTRLSDIHNLHLLKNGEELEIDGIIYRLRNDKFARVWD